MPATTKVLHIGNAAYRYYPIDQIEGAEKLPRSLAILLENILRSVEEPDRVQELASRLVQAALAGKAGDEVEFSPARVLFQDFTGVPVFVDFAAMREACEHMGGDPARVNPQVPCDLVIDHSVIADNYGCAEALQSNMQLEFERNRERYDFLKWSQESFDNVRIVPPGQGICHQLNMEQFASVVMTAPLDSVGESGSAGEDANAAAAAQSADAPAAPAQPAGSAAAAPAQSADDAAQPANAAAVHAQSADATAAAPAQTERIAYFDTLVGTDSHTTTIGGLGVLGYGVGGIEAEAASLGQPITTLVPEAVGIRLTGALADGITAMDAALTFAEMLRAEGVVGNYVECFGPGVANLTATQRACISNMTPEYGCTCTLFPIDEATLDYLRVTGRTQEQIDLVEAYAKAQGLWGAEDDQRTYAKVLELDLSSVKRSLAGPSRPHERFDFEGAARTFIDIRNNRNKGKREVGVSIDGSTYRLSHGAIAIAAVTSCTTATDPAMMVQCGLLARNAIQQGLQTKPWVKTVMAPGSRATQLLLQRAGLTEPLEQLGFATCGFGCMSCIGNSGPILPEMRNVSEELELASVLSGNRNFEGRISPDVAQNYLASPAAVVAYALAGEMSYDFDKTPFFEKSDGTEIFLADIWPSDDEVAEVLDQVLDASLYEQGSEGIFEGDANWQSLQRAKSDIFAWDPKSTYVRRAPYFNGVEADVSAPAPIRGAYCLAKLGDFITTDHISPAGSIAPDSAAAGYLLEAGVPQAQWNTYGSRRGNHEVMMRGTFANVKLENQMAGGRTGAWTLDAHDGAYRLMFDTAIEYKQTRTPLVVLAGKMYGSGSSRDWAAKGPALLGVRAVFAESFERIHRSNLIGMGILPLQFLEGENADTLGLDGTEVYDIDDIDFSNGLPNPLQVGVHAHCSDGSCVDFNAIVRIDTPTEGEYYVNGGILPYVVRRLAK